MLDESIPILNEYSKKISDILSNGKIQVTFNSDGKKRAGNAKLDIEVHSTESGNSYLKSSKGERRRIDLCVTLALRELIARRSTKSFDQVFIDEVFDGMDEEGAESVVALLRKYYSNKRVFVITHDSTIKSLLNSDRIVAQKVKHNQSEIRQFIDTVTEGVASTPMTDIVTPQKKKKRRALAL